MTVTATGTFCVSDSASTRSAMFFAIVSRSMSALALEAELSHGESESILRVARGLEPLFHKGCDSFLSRWSLDGRHAGVPAGSDFDVGRQAGFVDEALGVGDRPLVERGDPGCEGVDEGIQVGVRQRTV